MELEISSFFLLMIDEFISRAILILKTFCNKDEHEFIFEWQPKWLNWTAFPLCVQHNFEGGQSRWQLAILESTFFNEVYLIL